MLVVEDELMIAATLEMALTMNGYRVQGPVATVDEAIALIEDTQPDMALIDYRLARSTTEVLLLLLDDHKIPVCVLTGYSREQLPPAYAIYDVLRKPFQVKELLDKLAELGAR